MKRLLAIMISGLLVITFQLGYAQTEKGNWLIGGNGSFKHYTYSPLHTTRNIVMLNPDVGLFVINNLAVGILPAYQWEITHVKSDNLDFERTSSSALSIGPFARYYVGVAGRIKLFVNINYSLGRHFTNQKYNPSEKYNFDQYKIGIGSAFFLSKTAALEVSVGYMNYHPLNSYIANPSANSTNQNYNLLNIDAGFNIYLSGK